MQLFAFDVGLMCLDPDVQPKHLLIQASYWTYRNENVSILSSNSEQQI